MILERFYFQIYCRMWPWEDLVYIYCCWKQRIVSMKNLLQLQRKELFSMILLFESWTVFQWRQIPEHVYSAHLKYPKYALMLSVMIAETIAVESHQSTASFVDYNYEQWSCIFWWLGNVNLFIIIWPHLLFKNRMHYFLFRKFRFQWLH